MKNFYWGVVLVLFGILLLLQNLDIADIGDVISTYWPLLLILWGLAILSGKRSQQHRTGGGDPHTTVERELLQESHFFGNVEIAVSSGNFKGGSISTVFGNCVVDLSASSIAEGDHHLQLHSVFGDTLVKLPHGCAASINASSVLGNSSVLGQRRGGLASEVRVTTPEFASATHRLTVTASKIIGNTTIEGAP